MPRFLIEFRHTDDHAGCVRALDAVVNYGSHLVTHAEFGCGDGEHAGWMILEIDDRDQALQVIPPQFRSDAKIVMLRKWTPEEIEKMVKQLES